MEEMLISNGTVVFETYEQKADVMVRGGKIAAFYQPGAAPPGLKTLDAAGLHIMPGSIDPHTHWGIYQDYTEDVRQDSRRAVLGGLTTVLQFHRHNDDYFDSVPACIATCDRESQVDYTFSLGLVKKSHVQHLERYIRELKINSFKFYLDKTDRLESHYGLSPGTGLRGNKREILDILKKLSAIDPAAVLCLHCEDTEVFYPQQEEVFKDSSLDHHSLAAYSLARPDFGEASAVLSALWMNHVAEGHIYIVHTSAGDCIRLIRALKPLLRGRIDVETCPHYLILDDSASCGLDASVVPPIRTAQDAGELWAGIADGIITSIGTDNCPIQHAQKYARGNRIENIAPGFPGAGIILPVLIDAGYHKRGLSLSRLSQINSINTARCFNLKSQRRNEDWL
jgi:dihydroorotase-like cyclic amidohydrolase